MEKSKRAPIATATAVRNHEPKVSDTKRGIRIRHREFIDNVFLSKLFTLTDLPCNPGVSATFPWLSDIANSWEQYHFHYLRFRYITRTSTTTRGSIILAPEYDALDAPPADEFQLTAYYGAVEDAPWKNIVVSFDVDGMHPLGPRKFVRSADQPLVGDLKTYDVGVLYIGALDATDDDDKSIGGKLWVEYDVELFVPQKNDVPRAGPATPRFTAGFEGANRDISVVDFEPLFGTQEIVNTLGVKYNPVTGGIKFDTPGDYSLRVDGDITFTGVPTSDGESEVRAFIERSTDNGISWNSVPAAGTETQQKRACINFDAATNYNCETDFSWENILNVAANELDHQFRVAYKNSTILPGLTAQVRPATWLLRAAPLFAKALSASSS